MARLNEEMPMTEELTPKPAGRVRGRGSRTGQAPPGRPDRERRRHRRRDEGGHLRTRACEEIGVYYAISGWISDVRSLRQPRRGFLRVRKFLNAIDHVPHAEGALGRVSKHAPKPMQRLRALRGRFPRTLACRHHDHRRRGGDDGGGVDTFVWAIET